MPIDAEQSPGGVSDAGRLVGAVAAGVVAGIVVLAVGQWSVAPVAAWDVAAATFTVWVWASVWRLDAEATSRFATREDPSRATADILLLSASVASLAAVGLLLVEAGNRQGATQALLGGLALVSVVCWRRYSGRPSGRQSPGPARVSPALVAITSSAG